MRKGENPFVADKIHFHYLLYQKSESHNITLLVIFIFNIMACTISIIATLFEFVSFYFIIAYLLITIILIFSTSLIKGLINKIRFPKVKTKSYEQLPILQDTIFRLHYLSYVLVIYFIVLFASKYDQILFLPDYQSAALGFILISIFLLMKFFKNIYQRPDAILIMIASLQLFFIVPEQVITTDNKNFLELFYSWVRFVSLAASAIIFLDNVFLKDKKVINGSLSFSDVMFFMVLIGFLALQKFEIRQVFTVVVEISIIYLANKLFFISLLHNSQEKNKIKQI